MTYRNQTTAEESKNYILNKLSEETHILGDLSALTISQSVDAVLINIVVLLFLILIISLICLAYFRIISYKSAVIVFVAWSITILILAIVAAIYIRSYSKRKFSKASDIFVNYISSEEALELINEAAEVYVS